MTAVNVPSDNPTEVYLGATGRPVFDDSVDAEVELGATQGALLDERATNPTVITIGAVGAGAPINRG